MKFYIYSELKSGSWGGGNQFLKALKSQLISMGVYAESLRSTDVIIFNGYQELSGIFKNWFFHHKQKRVYRLGPILSLHRIGLRWRLVDFVVVMFASLFSDLVVFQSKWSYEKALKFGLMSKKKYAIIGNAVDDSIFYPKEFQDKKNKDKTKLIYTSWSSNMKKGFNYLKFLDNNLDFDKYDFTFIGNSPFEFKNIKIIKALPSHELAQKLRESDIFISPVEDDACSNALIEGLASGLPAVALNSGGNGEILGSGGELFSGNEDILEKINKVSNNLKLYIDNIKVKNIEEIAHEYMSAIKLIC